VVLLCACAALAAGSGGGATAANTTHVSLSAVDCGWQTGVGMPVPTHTLRPTVKLKRVSGSTVNVTVTMRLFEGASKIGELSAGAVSPSGEVTKGAASIPTGSTVSFRPWNANDVTPVAKYDLGFGDVALRGVNEPAGADPQAKYGGPPLLPLAPYSLHVVVHDFATGTDNEWIANCTAAPPSTGCANPVHVVVDRHGAFTRPDQALLTKPNSCWTWSRPGNNATFGDFWTSCNTHGTFHNEGTLGTDLWMFDDAQASVDDRGAITACARCSTLAARKASNGQKCPVTSAAVSAADSEVKSTVGYVLAAPPGTGLPGTGAVYLPKPEESTLAASARKWRVFAETFRSGTTATQNRAYLQNLLAGSCRGLSAPCPNVANVAPMTAIRSAGVPLMNEEAVYSIVYDFCVKATAAGIHTFGLYASNAFTDADAKGGVVIHSTSAMNEALNDCASGQSTFRTFSG